LSLLHLCTIANPVCNKARLAKLGGANKVAHSSTEAACPLHPTPLPLRTMGDAPVDNSGPTSPPIRSNIMGGSYPPNLTVLWNVGDVTCKRRLSHSPWAPCCSLRV